MHLSTTVLLVRTCTWADRHATLQAYLRGTSVLCRCERQGDRWGNQGRKTAHIPTDVPNATELREQGACAHETTLME